MNYFASCTCAIWILNEPIQFPLRHDDVDKVDFAKRMDVHITQTHRLLQPMVLLVAVVVLGRSQGVGYALFISGSVHTGLI